MTSWSAPVGRPGNISGREHPGRHSRRHFWIVARFAAGFWDGPPGGGTPPLKPKQAQ
jgi:hypothetical protein